MAPAQMSYGHRSRPPSAMGASTHASSANGFYAMADSDLAVQMSTLGASTSASPFTAETSSYYTSQTSNLSRMTLCYNCGEDDHLARTCKAPKKCFKCGQPGHSIKYCTTRLAGPPGGGGRSGRGGAQSRKLGHQKEAKVKSIFDIEYGDMVAAMKEAKTQEAGAGKKVQAVDIPDLIDLSSEPSETSSDNYDPTKSTAKVAPLHMSKQLYSKVIEGYSIKPQYDPVVDLVAPTLLDQIDEEQVKQKDAEGRVEVMLHRKRKGRKGRSTAYDLTPFLSY